MATNKTAIRRLSLPADIYKRLEALRDGQSWEAFVKELEAKLKPMRERNPRRFYFEQHLKERHLNEDEACGRCKKHDTDPQILKKLNYSDIVYNYASNMGIKVSKEVLQKRFAEAGYEPEMIGCPRCYALGGTVLFDIMLHELLPELTILSLQRAYQINKCNTAPH